jgi:hypothetical protein
MLAKMKEMRGGKNELIHSFSQEEEKKGPYGFSLKTGTWLVEWMSGGKEVENLSPEGIEELRPFRVKERTQVFRGLKQGEVLQEGYFVSEKMSSWTTSEEMAENFSENGVISIWVEPQETLIDTTRLNPVEVRKWSGFPEEAEVILLPGKWRIVS